MFTSSYKLTLCIGEATPAMYRKSRWEQIPS